MTRPQRIVVVAMAAAIAFASIAGVALLAQSPAASNDRYISIGAGVQRQRCKVLQTWTLPSGGTAYNVRGVDTGDLFTVVREGGDQQSNKEVFVRIFRWNNGIPAEGTPVAPPISGAPVPVPIHPVAVKSPVAETTVTPIPTTLPPSAVTTIPTVAPAAAPRTVTSTVKTPAPQSP